jgi:hypothetical protein
METRTEAAAAVNALVDEYRTRCLWFLRPDWYPASLEDRLRALDYIERRGDNAAFRRARALREWLSRASREASAG